mmetsp:Transcript_28435/g.62060  ORF Transcript_28435/g.62060 Transcript_28435/m.62060 type:complete len:497 (-) Transcript_28435:92-1582(-)
MGAKQGLPVPTRISQSASSGSSSASEGKNIADVVEDIGFGPSQARMSFIGGGVMMADGSELLLISSVVMAVANEWDLGPFERSGLITLVYLGLIGGNACSGPLGDRFGRRPVIVCSFFAIFIFSVLSSLSTSAQMLGVLRFFVGMAFGLGQPAWNALGSEITPAYWRMVNPIVGQILFIFGELYSCSLIYFQDPTMKNLQWRPLLRLGSLPAVFFGILAMSPDMLVESPRYLAVQGRLQEAMEVLSTMAAGNGMMTARIDFRPPELHRAQKWWEPITEIFSKEYRLTTFITTFGGATWNLIYYGALYAFPQILPGLTMGSSAAAELLYGALWELPGILLAIFLAITLPRRQMMGTIGVVGAVVLVMFAVGAANPELAHQGLLLHVGYAGIKLIAIPGFCIYYLYPGEVFPTTSRTTGMAFVTAGARVAAMVAPMLFEYVTLKWSFAVFFYLGAIMAFMTSIGAYLLPFETLGKALEDTAKTNESATNYGSASLGQA